MADQCRICSDAAFLGDLCAGHAAEHMADEHDRQMETLAGRREFEAERRGEWCGWEMAAALLRVNPGWTREQYLERLEVNAASAARRLKRAEEARRELEGN